MLVPGGAGNQRLQAGPLQESWRVCKSARAWSTAPAASGIGITVDADLEPLPHELVLRRRLLRLSVLLVLGLVGYCVWPHTEMPRPPAPLGPKVAKGVAKAQGEQANPAPVPIQRSAEAPQEQADLSLPIEFRLLVQVVDPFGLPQPDAHVFVAPPQCGFALAPDPTDELGQVVLKLHGRTTKLSLWLAVMAHGVIEPLRFVELTADATTHIVLPARGELQDTTELERMLDAGAAAVDLHAWLQLLRSQAALEQHAAGDPLKRGRLDRRDPLDFTCGRSLSLFRNLDCSGCHQDNRTASFAALQWARALLPRTGSVSPFADLRTAPPSDEEMASRRKALQVPTEEERQRMLLAATGADRTGMVEGRVRDAQDREAGFVPVAWVDVHGRLRARTLTDEFGWYRLLLPAGERCGLVCNGQGHGQGFATAVAVGGGLVRCDLRLLAKGLVQGTARDVRGDPLVKWRVELDGGIHGTGLTTTQENGSFTFAQLGAPARLLLWPLEADLRLPVSQSELVLPDSPPVTLRLTEASPARARLRLRAILPAGHERARVEMRVLQESTGRGAHLVHNGIDDAFELQGLTAGHYRGEIGAQGLGWIPFGPVYLDGRGLWDFGSFAFPRPGRLRLQVAEGTTSPLQLPHAIWRRGEAVDVAVDARPVGEDAVSLPPGRYALAYAENGVMQTREFTIVTAEDTTIAIGK